MERARNHRRVEPLAIQVLVMSEIPVDRGALRSPALPNHRSDLARAPRIDQYQSFPAETVQVLLHYASDQQCGDPRIERVTAAREDFESCCRCQRMAGRYSCVATHDRRALRSW